jgi:hypothetical protein
MVFSFNIAGLAATKGEDIPTALGSALAEVR